MLQGLLGGGTAGGAVAGAGGIGGVAGGVAVKSVGTATLLKGVAAVAVVAAIGVGGADRAGLIQIGGGTRGHMRLREPNQRARSPRPHPPAAPRLLLQPRRAERAELPQKLAEQSCPGPRGGADRAVHSARGASRSASRRGHGGERTPRPHPPCELGEHRHPHRHPRRARRRTSARTRPRKADAGRRRPRPGNGGEPQAGKDRELERLRTGLRQEQERRTSGPPDPSRDAGDLLAVCCRRT